MANTNNILLDSVELEKTIIVFNSKINNYIKSLKQRSSEEILNGSILIAQKVINQILPLEAEFRKMDECHNSFLTVIRNEKFFDSEILKTNVAKNDNLNNLDLSEMDFTPSEYYKVPILKSLIYLGGNAKFSEIVGFIEKEMKNKFKPADQEKGINGFGKLWIELVSKEKEIMIKEGLILENKKNEQLEIVQSGIDYLAQFSS